MTDARPLWLTHTPDADDLLTQVSAQRLMETVEALARWERHAGTSHERAAFAWLKGEFEHLGLQVNQMFHKAYISLPGPARLRVVEPEQREIPCTTLSFSQPAEGLQARLVSDSQGTAGFHLVNGLPTGATVLEAQEAGANGVLFYWDDHLHQGQVSPFWGSPTSDQMSGLPRIPAACIRRQDALWLLEYGRKQRIVLEYSGEVTTGWMDIPLLVAEQPGREEADTVVLVSAHVDSWYQGAMDNGAANATLLEVARILSGTETRRTIRYALWSGHSQGRYAGSAWYRETFGDQIARQVCVHINIDSTGGRGATVLKEAPVLPETSALGAEVVEAESGQQLRGRPMPRYADQSFLDLGIPSLFATLSEQPCQPDEPPVGVPPRTAPEEGGGLGWWWHTPEDTPDKLEPELLARDTRIYLRAIWRFANQPILPLDYGTAANDWEAALGDMGLFSHRPDLETALRDFRSEWKQTAEAVEHLMAQPPISAASLLAINRWLMSLSRSLVPPRYAPGSPWEAAAPVDIQEGWLGQAGQALSRGAEQCQELRRKLAGGER